MEPRAGNPAPFDEQAALEALERLREQIETYKSQRKGAEEEFERFVRSFKNPGAATEAEHEPKRVTRGAPRVETESLPIPTESLPKPPESVPQPPDSLPQPPERVPQPADSLPEPPESLPLPPESMPVPPGAASAPAVASRGTSRARAYAGGALILVVAGGTLAWTLRNRAPAATETTSPAPEPPARAAAPDPPAAAKAAPPQTELTTIRPVWVRVVADGDRVIERELPAGTRIPFSARKTIVIRTGDAGAVRLSIAGRDRGFLGREGEVLTRAFDVPPAAK